MGKDELVDTKKVESQVPFWLGETEAKEEFLRFLMRDALMRAEYYHTLMKPFEHKYAETYPEFKKKVELSENEATGEHALFGTHQAATWRLSRVSAAMHQQPCRCGQRNFTVCRRVPLSS